MSQSFFAYVCVCVCEGGESFWLLVPLHGACHLSMASVSRMSWQYGCYEIILSGDLPVADGSSFTRLSYPPPLQSLSAVQYGPRVTHVSAPLTRGSEQQWEYHLLASELVPQGSK